MRHEINSLSNHHFCIKPYNITQYDRLFAKYPSRKQYLHHSSILTEGAKIGLTKSYPTRLTNNNPSFSVSEKIGIGQQLKKWLGRHGTGSYTEIIQIIIYPFYVIWCRPDSSTE